MHGCFVAHWHDPLGCWWSVSKRTVRSERVVVFVPFLDNGLSFLQTVEDFNV